MKCHSLLSYAVTVGVLLFGGVGLAQTEPPRDLVAIPGWSLGSKDPEIFEDLEKILLKGILRKLKTESSQVDQIKQEGFALGERNITGLIDKFDSAFAGEMNLGVQKVSSSLAKKMGMTPQEMEQILGLFPEKTKADFSNVSVQEVANVMAKSIFLHILKNDSLGGSETDGRGSDAGSGNAPRSRFGNGVDPVANGDFGDITDQGEGVLDLRQISTIVQGAVGVGANLAKMNADWSAIEYGSGDDGESKFDDSTEDLNALERLEKRLQGIKNTGDAGSVPTTGKVYPSGSPGGVRPNASLNGMLSREMGAGEGGHAIDPENLLENDSKVPRVKYQSDSPGSQSSGR